MNLKVAQFSHSPGQWRYQGICWKVMLALLNAGLSKLSESFCILIKTRNVQTREFFVSICNGNPSTSNFILFGVVEMLQKLSLWAKGWHFWRAIITRSKFWLNHNYTITLSMLYIITRPLTYKYNSREHSCGLWGGTAVVSIWLARNILQVNIGLQFGSYYTIWTEPYCLPLVLPL